MRIVYDADVCGCHGQCVAAAPELFKFAGDGTLIVIDPTPTEDLREAAEDAVNLCPTRALSLIDD